MTLKFENVSTELYLITIVLAVVVFVFSTVKKNYLIIVVIIIMLSYFAYFYLRTISEKKENSILYRENIFENDIKDRTDVHEKIFYIDKFPKKCKYLKENDKLMNIIINIRFTKKFSNSRYSNIILNMNKLMKIYMYCLADRYDTVTYIPLFMDIRDNILEIMYSLIMIIPDKLKHTYGLDPYVEINKSITEFTTYSKEMLMTLENYARISSKAPYIPETNLRSYNIAVQSFYP